MEESNVPPQPIEAKKRINPLYIIGGLVVIGIIGYTFISGKGKGAPAPTPETVTENGNQVIEVPGVVELETSQPGEVKEFTVDGSSYKFDPDSITVNQGDTVKITFKDSGGPHDLVIDGYNVRTKIVTPGKEDSITFVADKAGSFKYYCSVERISDCSVTENSSSS